MRRTALWVPQSAAQWAGYLSKADELFYGGAAGGGKSDLLLGLAATAHRRSIIFRREYPQLMGIIDRGKQIITAEYGTYNGQDHVWRMKDGRQIELGAVQYEGDVQKYQGRPHDLVAFDEGPQFTEAQYRFLNGWKRTEDPNQRTRTVLTGNPPVTAEGRWVIDYWAPWLDPAHDNPALPGELRWFAVLGGEDVEVDGPEPIVHDGETIHPKSRTFIPARVEDNPFYMATGYKSQLQALPEPLRSALLHGDFRVAVEDDPWQIIPRAWVRAAMDRWQDGPVGPMTALGVDVARGGRDRTVLVARHGQWFAPLRVYPGSRTPDGPAVAALVTGAVGDANPVVNVDVIGVGASVYDHLRDRFDTVGVNFGEGSDELDRSGRLTFANVRAQAYWQMREALDPANGAEIALPDDPALLAELCTPRWTMRARGIQVESKVEIVKRTGRSPDLADAVVLALLPTATASIILI